MTPPPADPALLDEAVELARRAGAFTLEWFRRDDLAVDSKADGTPVTAADRGAERLLRDHIRAHHPGDGIVGEEEGAHAGTSGRRWIIDPIDGTKAFTRGVPSYSNLLAIDDEHGPAVGVINLPALGETVYAGRGLGCFCNGVPARVSTRSAAEGYLTASSFGDWSEAVLLTVRRSRLRLRTWGDGWGYALVATGRVEAMVDQVASVWDLAPMLVILPEAGGRFTDLDGNVTAAGGSGVGTNGVVHDEVLALLTTIP
jgi:histidinol phosphatase-like enzyme (inositol monophosphatase family)